MKMQKKIKSRSHKSDTSMPRGIDMDTNIVNIKSISV